MTAKLNYGAFEAMPAVWNGGKNFGYVYYDEWRKIPVAEINANAHVLTKTEFETTYSGLPPVPGDLLK